MSLIHAILLGVRDKKRMLREEAILPDDQSEHELPFWLLAFSDESDIDTDTVSEVLENINLSC